MSSIFLLVSATLSRAMGLLLMVLIARYGGLEDVGRFVVATAIGAFVFLAVDLGLGQRAAREGAAHPDMADADFDASQRVRWILICTAGLLLVIAAVIDAFIDRSWSWSLAVLAAFLPQSLAYGWECRARARRMMHVEMWSNLASSAAAVGIAAIGLVRFGEIFAVPLGLLVGAVLRWIVARVLSYPVPDVSGSVGRRRILVESTPYLLTTLVAVAFTQVDVLLIRLVTDASTAAVYALVSRPLLALGGLSAYVANAWIPHFAYTEEGSARATVPWAAFRRVAYLAALTVALLELTGRRLYAFVFGDAFLAVNEHLVLVAAPYVGLALMNAFLGTYLTGTGLQRLRARAVTLGLVVTSLLCFLLVPAVGVFGAALQFVVAEGFVFAALLRAAMSVQREIEEERRRDAPADRP